MILVKDGRELRKYHIAIGMNPIGHKQRSGDLRTPEGIYVLDYRNDQSKYYKSIHISYPSDSDLSAAEIREDDPGGDIFIHGMPPDALKKPWIYESDDWTDGCIAVSNAVMDEIWAIVPDGTPIEIRP